MDNLLNYNGAYSNGCMPSTGYGYSLNPLYQSYTYDQLWMNSCLYRPSNVIYNIYAETEKTFEAKKLRKNDGTYYMTERNGREVKVGRLKVKDKFIVNQHSDGTFDAFYCAVECEDNEVIDISIPYKDFVKRNILSHIPFFRRNADCPDKYIVMAFYHEILNGDDIKFLQLPQHSGWQKAQDGKTTFASAEIVIPKLRMYYSDDILERKMLHTEKTLTEAGEALAKALPAHWKYKLLVALRVTSVLLYLYRLTGLIPDQMFVIEPKSESNAHTASAILNNSQRPICRLTDCKTAIQHELALMNDGIALYRDSSYSEEKKRRDVGLDTLLNSLLEQSRSNAVNRNLSVVIEDNLNNISSEIPAYFISLDDCPDVKNNEEISENIGEFISALVKLLSNSDVTDNLITHKLKTTEFLKKNADNEDYYTTLRMLWATSELLCDYKVISGDDMSKLLLYLRDHSNEMPGTEQTIANEFRRILSKKIGNGDIEVATAESSIFFNLNKNMVYVDDAYINILAKTLNEKVLPVMKTTKRRNKLLSALKVCGKLYSNNHFKRNIDIETSSGISESFSVYSFTKDILDVESRLKIDTLAYDEFLFAKGQEPSGFIPIIKLNGSDKMCGCVINESTDEDESLDVSGISRSGKTRFLVEQAVIRYNSGKKVVIFDQTGSFSPEELEKHGVDKNMFVHWDIGKYGLPVDLLSLENCSTLPEKKNKLFSIFSVAASVTGEIQGKTLKKILPAIARAIDAGTIHSLPETLRFFDEDAPEEAIIKERLEEVFCELEGLNTYKQNWGQFIDSQNGIVVISTSADGIRKSSPLVDMLLASLYEYKQHDRSPRYTIVLDEIEDLCLEKDGPISTILRKGAKHHLSMMLATQEYSVEKDKLGKLIGNCATHVIFRPKEANIKDIAKHIGVDASTLASLQQGQCIVSGLLYSKKAEKNKHFVIIGWTCMHDD
ncbi:hypothetical protein [Ruminococcus flavefaciens]|uniref:hypothetical protein n=1 Tax=Ruminococcus flavefaciens TaxID=1265 RepID=UPI000490854F|nr:hypothetical protein [Ruminococcus flavefaciens]